MDIDLRTFLLVLIVIVGVIFILLVSNYSLFDVSDNKNIEEMNSTKLASTSIKNTTQKSQNTTSNTINTSQNTINKLMSVTNVEEDGNIEVNEEDEDLIEESNISNNNLKSPFELSLIEKNNTSPKLVFNETERYLTRTVRYSYLKTSCSLNYKVPESWASRNSVGENDPITGANLIHNGYSLSQFGEYNENETTYEEFLNDFIEYERKNDTFPDYVDFRTRELAINESTTFPILEKVGYYSITNYMVFVYNGNVISLEITVSNDDDYNDDFLSRIDNIFRSAYINY